MHTTTSGAAPSVNSPVNKPGLLINRNFGLLWVGQSISAIGDFVFTFTLVVWIALGLAKGQPWAPLAVSGVLLAEAIPIALVGPLAGVFVDRWDKRRTMLAVDGTRAIIVAALLLVSGVVPLPFVPGGRLPLMWQLGAIYASVFLVNALGRFFNPASTALLGDIVAESMRTRASGMLQTSASLAILIGPGVAPALYLAVGPWWALLANALSFVVSFVTVWAIAAPSAARSVASGERKSVLRELGAGLRFFSRSRILMTLAVAVVIIMLGGGALNALDVFFSTQNLHASATVYGLLGVAYGVGSIAGSVVASAFAGRIRAARMIWLGFLGLGILMLVYSRLTSAGPALALLFIVGICNAAVNVGAGPLVLHVTPREYVGRVTAVINPLGSLASLVSIAAAGYLASTLLRGLHAQALGMTFGAVDTIFAAAGVLGVVCGLYCMLNLRGVRLAGEKGAASLERPLAGDDTAEVQAQQSTEPERVHS
ncbi:MAG TPA: MFS transporter [Ktedonobacterales bacterium]|nr:MFS transporter [Ktedonobacterales bacterium]